MEVAALLGTLAAPLLWKSLSGFVISLGGIVSLVGLACAGPTLLKAWKQQSAASEGVGSVRSEG